MRSWWSRRWTKVFETSAMTSRLSRGRQYAREGAVFDLTAGRGTVEALVRGSRRRPYKVKVRIDPLSGSEWTRVARALAGESGLLAQVLSGSLPERLEEVLASGGASLFPRPSRLWAPTHCSCSCPDEANPCKHICAVFYVLLDRLEADPLLTFVLRGKAVDEVLHEVRRYRGGQPEGVAGVPAVGGVPATGGIPTTGDVPTAGGVPTTGGVPAAGGVPTAGGALATGGVPVIEDEPSLEDAIGGPPPPSYTEFWSLEDVTRSSPASGSSDVVTADSQPVPAAPSGNGVPRTRESESGGATAFTFPPLPFADRQSLGRRAIEQLYRLAGRVAEQYLERMWWTERVSR